MLNEQQIYDQTLFHLRQQGTACASANAVCRYRAHNMACAVGCHLTNAEYSPDMERYSVEQLISQGKFPERLLPYRALLKELQTAHDIDLACDMEAWERQMKVIAKYFGLTYTENNNNGAPL